MIEYSITGLDFSPNYIWLDEAGKFFAGGDTWAMVIREGFEPGAQVLLDAQKQAQDERNHELAHKLMHHPKGGALIRNVTVFDSVNAKLLPAQDVLISGNKIVSVKPSSKAALTADSTEVIDGTGKTLIPGLWDMHAHVSGNDGLLNLAAGVTTVRDMANDIEELTARRRRIEGEMEVGTRIIACGFIDGPGPYQGPTKILASTEKQARDFVDMYAEARLSADQDLQLGEARTRARDH